MHLQVGISWAAGDLRGARKSADNALIWNMVTIVSGIVVITFIVIVSVVVTKYD